MRIGVLGTGQVGRGHAARLRQLDHDVLVGTRDPGQQPDADQPLVSFADAVRDAELVINALNGSIAADALASIAAELAGRIVLDVTNPLDFSSGQLELFVCNTDSLGERIQRAVPDARVVKSLCTVNIDVQVDPATLAGGEHDMFVAGNDDEAKAAVEGLLREYGWRTVIDLGDLTAARSLEMLLPMWVRLYQGLGTARFNYRLVTDPA